MKAFCIALLTALFTSIIAAAASSSVDVYSPQQLSAMSARLAQKKTGFASQSLENYGNHHTMLAFREQTGSAEVHETEADIFIATKGSASIVTGGKLVAGHQTDPHELRGTSVQGGERHELQPGAVLHIPAGVPHQLIIHKGTPFTYFVVKVVEQP
jgi:mannose-6-phosphate isomerase-like protein (cupin superfamily)